MMLNGYGAVKRSVALPRPEDDPDQPQTRRRSTGQAMAMGAPLGAGFLGLLLMRGKDAAAAEPDEAATRPVVDGGREPAASVESDGGGGTAGPSLGAALAGGMAAVAGNAALDLAGPATAAEPTAGVPVGAPATSRATVPEGGADAEATAPPAPDIGDVVLAFGSEAPFALPESDGEVIETPDENIGDLGDPRDVEREPITAPDDDLAAGPDDGGSDVGQPPAPANPGLRIIGTPQNDYLVGTDGDDVIDAVGGKNTVMGGAGDDLIRGGTGNDVLRGGPGNDTIYGGAGNNQIYGDEGDNQLFGGTGNDAIYGGAGNDRLDGGGGINQLYAGTGNSTLVVNDWRDVALGNDASPGSGGGVDTLEVAPSFAASLRGKFSGLSPDGSTTFVMGSGEAGRTVPADTNDFKWQVDPRIEQVRLTGDDSHDVVASDQGNTIWGNDGDNRLYGGAGDDLLYAGGGDNSLHGGDGNDTLHAGSGNDFLYGDAGDDVLYGGAGEAELHGGEGDDLYLFGLAEGGRSTIFDHSGVNRLRFEGLDDPSQLDARMDGDDLVIGNDGADIVRIDDYAGHRENFAGVEHGGEVLSLDRFIREPGTADAAPTSTPGAGEDDLLAIYLGPQSVDAGDDILDPAWLDDDGPAHDAPFALYEGNSAGFTGPGAGAGAGAETVAADGGADDLLGSFMRAEPLWIGPEDGLYAPDAAAYPDGNGEEAQQARG
jgi:Ca2+-binding RTX toxin-like protein